MDRKLYDDAILLCAFRLLRCVWFYFPPAEAQEHWHALSGPARQLWASLICSIAMERRSKELKRLGLPADVRMLGDMVDGNVARPASAALAAEQAEQLENVLGPWAEEQWKVLTAPERQTVINAVLRRRGGSPPGGGVPSGGAPTISPAHSGIDTRPPQRVSAGYVHGVWTVTTDDTTYALPIPPLPKRFP